MAGRSIGGPAKVTPRPAADSLHCSFEECERVAAPLTAHTGGRPLFARHLLRALYHEVPPVLRTAGLGPGWVTERCTDVSAMGRV